MVVSGMPRLKGRTHWANWPPTRSPPWCCLPDPTPASSHLPWNSPAAASTPQGLCQPEYTENPAGVAMLDVLPEHTPIHSSGHETRQLPMGCLGSGRSPVRETTAPGHDQAPSIAVHLEATTIGVLGWQLVWAGRPQPQHSRKRCPGPVTPDAAGDLLCVRQAAYCGRQFPTCGTVRNQQPSQLLYCLHY